MIKVNDTLVIETTTTPMKARIIYIHKRSEHITNVVLDNGMLLTIKHDGKITAVLSKDGVVVDSSITNIKHYPCFFVIGQEYRITEYVGYAKGPRETKTFIGKLTHLPFVRRITTTGPNLKTIYNLEDFDLSDIPQQYEGVRDTSMINLRLTEGDKKGTIEHFAVYAPPPTDKIVSIEKVVRGAPAPKSTRPGVRGGKKLRKTKRNIKKLNWVIHPTFFIRKTWRNNS